MKKRAYILAFVLILLSSCNTKVDINDISLSSSQSPEASINIEDKTRGDFEIAIYKRAYEKDQMSEEDAKTWQDYIEKLTNNKVRIYYETINEVTNRSEGTLVSRTNRSGLFYVDNALLMKQFVGGGGRGFVPINDYIDTSHYGNDLKRYITNEGGLIWLLPTYHKKEYLYRTYDRDFLDAMDYEVPKTTNDFYLLASQLRYTEDTYIASYTNRYILTDLMDIFLAFGCYVNIDFTGNPYNHQFAYNPEKNTVENVVYSENFKAAMEYIKMLKDENLIYNCSSNLYNDDITVMSYFLPRPGITIDKKEFGLGLEGIKTENIIYCNDEVYGFIMLENTEDPQKTISFFEDYVFTDRDIQLAFNYGIEDINYKLGNNTLLIYEDSPVKRPGIIIEKYDQLDGIAYLINNEVMVDDETDNKILNQMIIELDQEKIYRANINLDYIKYFSKVENHDIQLTAEHFSELMINILDLGTDIDTAIANYKIRVDAECVLESFNDFVK